MRVVIVLALTGFLLVGCSAGVSATPSPTPAPTLGSTEAPTSTPPPSPSPEQTPEATPMPTDTPSPAPFGLTSPAFHAGAGIPSRYTCDGRGVSPPLAWTGVPAGTKALLLTVTDPDARGFVHWVAWDLPPDAGGLDEGASGALPGGAVEGRNDFGRTGWGGPCPPAGKHRYVFTLTALSAPLGLPRGSRLEAVERQAAGVTIEETQLAGTYRR